MKETLRIYEQPQELLNTFKSVGSPDERTKCQNRQNKGSTYEYKMVPTVNPDAERMIKPRNCEALRVT